ncbi:MAG: hypothetical protein R2741_09145 [Methanolobus sp.]
MKELIDAYEAKELEPLPGRTLKETIEMRIMQVLGKARDQTGNIAGQQLGLENSAVLMAKSGARGSMLNLTQMAACVGQQAVQMVKGRRGYAGRTLPHFTARVTLVQMPTVSLEQLQSGLNPTEYFFPRNCGRMKVL